ncbi:MAG: efflux RND transporter periplasmic adaptor subunit [Steroidobacteraceae bacterium]
MNIPAHSLSQRLRPWLRRRWILGGALALLALLGWFLFLRGGGAGKPTYETGKVDRGNIETSVSSSGSVSALVTVTVGSQISGILQEVLVDYNAKVKKNQLLAIIDPSTYRSRVQSAGADLLVQQANVGSAEVQVSNAQVLLDQAQRDHERARQLADRGLISTNDLEKARNAFEQAQNNTKIAQANLNNARAQTVKVKANLDQARIDLSRTEIRSPVDGVVVARKVDPGQTVAAAMQAPTLFQIAQDLARIQIETLVDEADIGSIREGANATFTVDAYPERSFRGRVAQVRINGVATQNVVTYSVMVQAENRDQVLLPGMTANVRIITNHREQVLRVPGSALRFRPAVAGDNSALLGMGASGGGGGGGGGMPRAGGGFAGGGFPGGGPGGGPGGMPGGGTARTGGGGGERPIIEMTPEVMKQLGLDAKQQAAVTEALQKVAARARAQAQGTGTSPLGGMPNFRAMFGNNDAALNRQRVENALRGVLTEEQMQQYLAMGSSQAVRPGTIYVLGKDGKPEPRPVRIGLADDSYTEIVEGLKEGDEIIVRARAGKKS